jgi:archaemetzincin
MNIILRPIGIVEAEIVTALKEQLALVFGCPVRIALSLAVPELAFHTERAQYRASLFIDMIVRQEILKGEKLLGITGVDLFSKDLNFVFGEASPSQNAAVISLYRLRDEISDGLPDNELVLKRTVKEAVHELGHLFGLDHCSNTRCVMHFSSCLADTDIKENSFCSKCQPKLIK